MTSTCPSCSRPASGRFCSHCGANLREPGVCSTCGGTVPPGGRFCTDCGAAAEAPLSAASATNEPAARASGPRSMLPWAIAAAALVALLAIVLYPRFQEGGSEPLPATGPPITSRSPTAAPGGAVDLASMSPREAADRLFNRVMQSVSSGDTAQAQQFLPMAISAYGRIPDLDRDGRYHVAVLQLVAANPQAARAQADTILAQEPTHLFGLATAAQAEAAMGNERAAGTLYRQFLASYDAEVARQLPEYAEHPQVLPAMRQEAQEAVGGGS